MEIIFRKEIPAQVTFTVNFLAILVICIKVVMHLILLLSSFNIDFRKCLFFLPCEYMMDRVRFKKWSIDTCSYFYAQR